MFVACQPEITWPDSTESRIFKYRIDFGAVERTLETTPIAAIAVSRPTNPTGNVLTDEEVQRLAAFAETYEIPLILDNAYGAPFPGVIFTAAKPFWKPHVIMTLSLSKLGLPGTRTAVVIGTEQIASAMTSMTAIAGLANGNIGQQLVLPLVESGEILELGPKYLRPFYAEKRLKPKPGFENTLLQWTSIGLCTPVKEHSSIGCGCVEWKSRPRNCMRL